MITNRLAVWAWRMRSGRSYPPTTMCDGPSRAPPGQNDVALGAYVVWLERVWEAHFSRDELLVLPTEARARMAPACARRARIGGRLDYRVGPGGSLLRGPRGACAFGCRNRSLSGSCHIH